MASAYAIASLPDGSVKYSDGSVKKAQTVPASGMSSQYAANPSTQVKGASTQIRSTMPQSPAPAPAPTPQPQQQSYNGPSQEDLINQQANEAYKGANSYLDSLEADYKQQFPTTIQGIKDQTNNEILPQIEQGRTSNLNNVADQRNKGVVAQKGQLSDARQLASEMQQSNLTRFGGASSTADAASELLNRQTYKQMSDIGNNFQQYNQDLDKENIRINTYYDQKKQEATSSMNQNIRQAQDTFDSKIREINSKRQELESNKAAMRLSALQQYAAEVRQAQTAAQQFAQQLDLWKQSKDEAIKQAKEFGAKSFTVPGFKNIIGGYSIKGQSAGSGTGGTDLSNVQGIVSNLGDQYGLDSLNVGSNGKTSYTIGKKSINDYSPEELANLLSQ